MIVILILLIIGALLMLFIFGYIVMKYQNTKGLIYMCIAIVLFLMFNWMFEFKITDTYRNQYPPENVMDVNLTLFNDTTLLVSDTACLYIYEYVKIMLNE